MAEFYKNSVFFRYNMEPTSSVAYGMLKYSYKLYYSYKLFYLMYSSGNWQVLSPVKLNTLTLPIDLLSPFNPV